MVHVDSDPWFDEASGVQRADFQSVRQKPDGSGWFLSQPGKPCHPTTGIKTDTLDLQ